MPLDAGAEQGLRRRALRTALGLLVRNGVQPWWVIRKAGPLLELPYVVERAASDDPEKRAAALVSVLDETLDGAHERSYVTLLRIVLGLDPEYLGLSARERREKAGKLFRGGEQVITAGSIRQYQEPKALDWLTELLLDREASYRAVVHAGNGKEGSSRALRSGEPPLTVFISSVMRDELAWAREAAVEALTVPPVVVPWAFEYTPASSMEASRAYLSKVRQADVVLWLIEAETSPAVRAEIETALSSGRRLIAIRLPAKKRDGITEELLAHVKNKVKLGEASSPDELRDAIDLALKDEIKRAMQDKAPLARFVPLEELARASRGRMIERWQAVGLSRQDALALADADRIGAPADEFLPTADEPLRILTGDVGSGKSHMAELIYQQALTESSKNPHAPFPVFLTAEEARADLRAEVEKRAAISGFPRTDGFFVVIDGADEVERAQAAQIIQASRRLVETIPNSRVVVTTRPFVTDAYDVAEARRLPLLDDDERRQLIGRIAGYEIPYGMVVGWPSSIADATCRPLFAILLGLELRREERPSRSVADLLDFLVRQALKGTLPDALPLLTRLAVLATDSGERSVHEREVAGLSDQEPVLRSRLVVRDGRYLRFALPILSQWFAAQALVDRSVETDALLGNANRLERWRYPIAIAAATAPSSRVDEILEPVVRAQPGFAALIIDEAVRRWWGRYEVEAPSNLEAARALRRALDAWDEGFRPLSQMLFPHDYAGRIPTVAARTTGSWVSFGWHLGQENHPDRIAELPDTPSPEWLPRFSGHINDKEAWHWGLTKELVKGDLRRRLQERALVPAQGPLLDEAIWRVALSHAGRSGSLSREPIPLAPLLELLRKNAGALPFDGRGQQVHLDALRSRLEELHRNGTKLIEAPWPGPDSDYSGAMGWIWSRYSPEQQLARVRAVYAAALETYVQVVEAAFPRLASRLVTYATLPASLVGVFCPGQPAQTGAAEDWPALTWYLEARPHGDRCDVQITFEGEQDMLKDVRAVHAQVIAMRPNDAPWLTAAIHHQVADVFQLAPVTELVYDWLERDLRGAGWSV